MAMVEMRKFVFEFDTDESKTLYDLFELVGDDLQEKELQLVEAMEAMRDYKVTITVEEVK